MPDLWDTGMYPGVGVHSGSSSRVYHAYYQWVPYYLLMLAAAFYFPHLLWKVVNATLNRGINFSSLRLLKAAGQRLFFPMKTKMRRHRKRRRM